MKPLLIVACIAVLAIGTLGVAETTAPSMNHLAFEVEISPVADTNQFETRFLVSDLDTEKIVFAPRIQAPAGQLATATSGGDDGTTFKADVVVRGREARYSVSAMVGKKVIATNFGVIRLNQ